MAEEQQTETQPTEAKKPESSKEGGKSWMVIGVVALLALGGVFLYNQMTKTPAEQVDDAMENTKEEAMDEAENKVDNAEEAVENMEEQKEEVMENAEDALKNLAETAEDAGGFATLLAAAKATGLDATLATGGPYTVFAPNEEAFKKLPAGTLESLLKDPAKLSDILKYHIVSGKVMSNQIANGMESPTVQGAKVSFTVNPDGTVEVNNAKVVKADVNASNGVIHVIDTVLIPVEN